jgi:hypothetical protein
MKLFKFIYWKFYDFRNPQPPRPFGITLYCGLPGQGKTLSMCHDLQLLRQKFPKAKIATNFNFKDQDAKIETVDDLVNLTNGEDGYIFAIDEIQSVFFSRNFKNFPMEILHLITQNRKHAKMILGTAQRFMNVDIQIRALCTYVYECANPFRNNRWFFLRKFYADEYNTDLEREEKKRKYISRHSYIATNTLYSSYDTLEVVSNIADDSTSSSPASLPPVTKDGDKPAPAGVPQPEEVKGAPLGTPTYFDLILEHLNNKTSTPSTSSRYGVVGFQRYNFLKRNQFVGLSIARKHTLNLIS